MAREVLEQSNEALPPEAYAELQAIIAKHNLTPKQLAIAFAQLHTDETWTRMEAPPCMEDTLPPAEEAYLDPEQIEQLVTEGSIGFFVSGQRPSLRIRGYQIQEETGQIVRFVAPQGTSTEQDITLAYHAARAFQIIAGIGYFSHLQGRESFEEFQEYSGQNSRKHPLNTTFFIGVDHTAANTSVLTVSGKKAITMNGEKFDTFTAMQFFHAPQGQKLIEYLQTQAYGLEAVAAVTSTAFQGLNNLPEGQSLWQPPSRIIIIDPQRDMNTAEYLQKNLRDRGQFPTYASVEQALQPIAATFEGDFRGILP